MKELLMKGVQNSLSGTEVLHYLVNLKFLAFHGRFSIEEALVSGEFYNVRMDLGFVVDALIWNLIGAMKQWNYRISYEEIF